MASMTATSAAKLRAAFKAEQIGKLPKLNCKACSDSPGKVCPKHKKQNCSVCGNWISSAHIHLDYVGHAATTDRLLSVDPEWTWEPMGIGPNGEPLMTNGGMWIKLTLCGVTRPGFGDGKNPKEVIGDAIRNAAMRFGVALDLWAKEDLHASSESTERETVDSRGRAAGEEGSSSSVEAPTPSAAPAPGVKKITKAQAGRLYAIAGTHKEEAKRIVFELTGAESSMGIPEDRYDEVVAAIEKAVAVAEAPFA